ncbi:MAG: PIN domain-containing protein [Gaiellaceae bacterium]
MARLILDTSVLVAAQRHGGGAEIFLADSDDCAIAAVTAAELLVGVEVGEGRSREERRRYVEAMLDALTVEEYDLDVARDHAVLLASVRRSGRPRGAHDLIIAATAVASGRAVVTTDTAGFADLPGVTVRSPAA